MKEKAIAIRGLDYAPAGTSVLEGVNLEVEAGEFVGLIGPNGGGKTTLLRAIMGDLAGGTGEITVFGQKVGAGGFDRSAIGFVPQRDNFTADFPASPLDAALMGRVPGRGLLRRLTRADRQAAAEAVDIVGLGEHARRPMGELSGGQQQRAFIARALAQKPRLLLLDEPMTGVDKAGESDFFALLGVLNRERGLTIVMASHDLTTVARNCGKIACINRKMHCHASPAEIDHAKIAEIYGRDWEVLVHGDAPHRMVEKHEKPPGAKG